MPQQLSRPGKVFNSQIIFIMTCASLGYAKVGGLASQVKRKIHIKVENF